MTKNVNPNDISTRLSKLLVYYDTLTNNNFSSNIRVTDTLLNLSEKYKGNVIINKSLWEDLDIFSVNGLFQNLQRCHTYFGFVTQYYLLVNPSTTPQINMPIIYRLVTDKGLYHKIKVLLNEIREAQDDILWFIKPKSSEQQKIYDDVFFSHNYFKKLNKNRLSVFIYYLYRTIIQPVYVIISPILCFIIPYIVLRFKMGLKLSISIYIKILKQVLPASFGIITKGDKSNKQIIWIYLSSIISALLYIQTVYSQVSNVFTLMDTSKLIKTRVNKLKKTLDNIRIIGNNLAIPNNLGIPPYLADITTYEPTSSYLWRYWLLNLNGVTHLKEWMSQLGQYDMLCSIAIYIRHVNEQSLPICYPIREVSNNKSHLFTKDIWHPGLLNNNNNKLVTNSFELGNKYKRNMLLTGPNAGGKSTLVKAITINCLLAQTFGFTTSRYFSYTPYHLIYTHFRIQDLTGEKSLFQEEVNRCQFMFNKLGNYPFLTVFDELFCSTSIIEGISCAYALAEIIGSYKNGTSFITTHYPLLTNISATSSSFINTKMECIINNKKDINKKPIFTYKLLKGKSNCHVALNLLNTSKDTFLLVKRSNEIKNILLKNTKDEFIFSKKTITTY